MMCDGFMGVWGIVNYCWLWVTDGIGKEGEMGGGVDFCFTFSLL
jgi:hypothetical protein